MYGEFARRSMIIQFKGHAGRRDYRRIACASSRKKSKMSKSNYVEGMSKYRIQQSDIKDIEAQIKLQADFSFSISDSKQKITKPPSARTQSTWCPRKIHTRTSGLLYPNSPIRPSLAPRELVTKQAQLGRADLLRCRHIP